jgi:hypothetical protein
MIKKTGKVIITSDEILIQGFHIVGDTHIGDELPPIDLDNLVLASDEIVDWAIQRLKEGKQND